MFQYHPFDVWVFIQLMKQAIKKSDGSRVAVKMVDKVEGIVIAMLCNIMNREF